ncbi:MAG: hypothetical protein Q8P22_02840 [Chloroflexota bacterium]|nr:hypothetical protein [Chloroflexota bacterium]
MQRPEETRLQPGPVWPERASATMWYVFVGIVMWIVFGLAGLLLALTW